MPIISINVAENISTNLMALAQQLPEILYHPTWNRLSDSIDLAQVTLENKVPVGATGKARDSIAGTRKLVMPFPQAFVGGEIARASVGYGVPYGWYVEYGRGRGRYPPEGPIVLWIEQTSRGQAFLAEFTANMTRFPSGFASPTHYAAFLLRRAHARRGTKFYPPQPPPRSLQLAYEEVKPRVIEIFNGLPAEVATRATQLLKQVK